MIRIDAIAVGDDDARPSATARIDTPRPEFEIGGYTLDISGSVTVAGERLKALDIVHRHRRVGRAIVNGRQKQAGEPLPTAVAEPSTFSIRLGTLALPRAFEIGLEATIAGGARFEAATIRGTRDGVQSGYSPRLQPLIVNTLGRSGSTWIVSLLAAHQQVGAFKPHAHDARLAAYWMSVLQSLSQPSSYLAPFAPQDMSSRDWWLRGAVMPLGSPPLEAWLSDRLPGSLAAMCQEQLDAFYLATTEVDASRDPAYFVEKFVPRQPAVDLLRELYPGAREIILVRDFRDILCSIVAFNRKRGYQAFGRDRVGSDAEYVRVNLSNSAESLLERWRENRDTAHLVRYEDLIRNPSDGLRGMLGYLDLASNAETIDAMLSNASARASAGHRTTAGPSASVGRWRTDLPDELKAVCEEALAPALAGFGYES